MITCFAKAEADVPRVASKSRVRLPISPEAVRDVRQLDPRQVPDAEISLSVMTDDRRPHDNRRRARNCRSAATSLEGVSRREADVLRLA